MTDESYGLPLTYREIDITQHPLLGVAEGDVSELDRLVEGHRLGVLRILYRTLGSEDTVYTLHRGHPSADRIEALAELLEWIDEAVEDDEVVDEGRGRDRARLGENQRAPVPEDDDDSDRTEEFAHRVR